MFDAVTKSPAPCLSLVSILKNIQTGQVVQYAPVFKLPLKEPLNLKLPSFLTVALCGILTSNPFTKYALVGKDEKASVESDTPTQAVNG